MFRWQPRARLSYSCPAIHTRDAERTISPRLGVAAVPPSSDSDINLETIYPIFRYYENGPESGISVGWLNHSGKNWAGIPQETRVRWSSGQLIVYTQWTLDQEVLQACTRDGRIWKRFQTCCHDWAYWRALNAMYTILEQTDTIKKCPYCAYDVEISQECLEDGSVRSIVRSWCNYGNSQSDDLSIKQNLRPMGIVRIDQAIREQRNIRDLFDSGEDETDEEIKNTMNIRKKLEYDQQFYSQLTCSIQ